MLLMIFFVIQYLDNIGENDSTVFLFIQCLNKIGENDSTVFLVLSISKQI